MFDTRPGPLTDPKQLDNFDRIFGHGEYAESSDTKKCCKKEHKDKKDCDCKK